MTSPLTTTATASSRSSELLQSLSEIRTCVKAASVVESPVLVAVSKYKPCSDILACYEHEQRDFGENYVQELVDKAKELPLDIRWHFIGTLQSNKAKILACIPNLYSIQTLTSQKTASLLNKALSPEREPLNVLIQVNTSGEESKSGIISPLTTDDDRVQLTDLAKYIVADCPRLRLQGLMTIGALEASLSVDDEKNKDFESLRCTRDVLQEFLIEEYGEDGRGKWGCNGKLVLSMGMSSDYEAALKAGSDIVRVGTGIFGERRRKT